MTQVAVAYQPGYSSLRLYVRVGETKGGTVVSIILFSTTTVTAGAVEVTPKAIIDEIFKVITLFPL
jgi:hypothetical protein